MNLQIGLYSSAELFFKLRPHFHVRCLQSWPRRQFITTSPVLILLRFSFTLTIISCYMARRNFSGLGFHVASDAFEVGWHSSLWSFDIPKW